MWGAGGSDSSCNTGSISTGYGGAGGYCEGVVQVNGNVIFQVGVAGGGTGAGDSVFGGLKALAGGNADCGALGNARGGAGAGAIGGVLMFPGVGGGAAGNYTDNTGDTGRSWPYNKAFPGGPRSNGLIILYY